VQAGWIYVAVVKFVSWSELRGDWRRHREWSEIEKCQQWAKDECRRHTSSMCSFLTIFQNLLEGLHRLAEKDHLELFELGACEGLGEVIKDSIAIARWKGCLSLLRARRFLVRLVTVFFCNS
jgi:hypothetical protein